MSAVGIIVNPWAGKDVRRLLAPVGHTPDTAKIAVVRRIAIGALDAGASEVLVANDVGRISERAVRDLPGARLVEGPGTGSALDTRRAASQLAEAGCAVVVVLGGDGTCRDVAIGWPDATLVAVSTGTNNVFPSFVDGSSAGTAAGLVSAGSVPAAAVGERAKLLRVDLDGPSFPVATCDIALVDVGVIDDLHIGARAVTHPEQIRLVVAAIASPSSTGLSAIVGRVAPIGRHESGASVVALGGDSRRIRVPIVPGLFDHVGVASVGSLKHGQAVRVDGPCVLAYDGERDRVLRPGDRAQVAVTNDGPFLIDVHRTLSCAVRRNLFDVTVGPTSLPPSRSTTMPTDVPMPKLGLTMEEATILSWLVPDGAEVTADQPLMLIETDKTETEVGAPGSGRHRQLGVEGGLYPCGTVVGWLLAEGEDAADSNARPGGVRGTNGCVAGLGRSRAPATAASAASATSMARIVAGRVVASPNARRVAAERGISLRTLIGSGPDGRIVSADVLAATVPPVAAEYRAEVAPARTALGAPVPVASSGISVGATIAARQLADLLGVDLAQVPPDPIERRVTRDGVALYVRSLLSRVHIAAAQAGPAPTPPAAPTPWPLLQEPTAVFPLRGMRGTIAKRMHASLQEMAQLSLSMDADLGALLADREARRAASGTAPSVTDYVVAATARALLLHPRMNAQMTGDGIALLGAVHVGLAVAVDNGLLVPVVRDTAHRDLADLAAETSRLAAAARGGTITPSEIEGGTFSVSALGAYGVDAFTPVINPPNAGILGIGRLRDDLVLSDGAVVTTKRLTLSLTWDHRVLDGVPAAEFCRTVVDLLANPDRLG